VWLCQARRRALRAQLSAFPVQPWSVELIRGQGREPQAIRELLSVLRVLQRPVLPGMRADQQAWLAQASLLPELYPQER
jgi:hypothetical protein